VSFHVRVRTPERGASTTEWILIALLVAIGTLAAVTLFGRLLAAKYQASSKSLDGGTPEKSKRVFDLRAGTGIPGYMPDAANPIGTDPNAPPVPLYGNVPGRPLNPPAPDDFYINPLGGGTAVGGMSGPLDNAHLPPVLTFPSAVGTEFRRMAGESAADAAGREKFAYVVRNTSTGEVTLVGEEFLGTNNGGAPSAPPALGPNETIVGTVHTHPNAPQGDFTAPQSSPDINFQLSRGDPIAFVQSGGDTFALATTNATPAGSGPAAAAHWDTAYAAYLAAGHNIRDARHLALQDTARAFNMAFYRGDSTGRLVLSN